MRVDVYRNLHTGNYSIRHKGRVVDHADEVWIEDATFVVNPAGRKRVLRDKRKNVHAFVRGERAGDPEAVIDAIDGVAIKYNPYEAAHFFETGSGRAVDGAARVYIGPHGVIAFGLRYAEEADRDDEFPGEETVSARPGNVVTDAEIRALSQRAACLGDQDRVALCQRALLQEAAARRECWDIIQTEPDATVDPLADIPVLH